MLRHILNVKNIPLIVAIIAALLSFTNLPTKFGVDPNLLILTLLGLIAIDHLVERVGLLEEIKCKVDNFPESNINNNLKPRAESHVPIKELEQSNEILICSKNIGSLIETYYGIFQTKIQNNCSVRIILVNPKDDATVKVVSTSSLSTPDTHDYKQLIETTIKKLLVLRSSVGQQSGNLEVRIIDFIPPFGLTILNSQLSSGKIFVELYSHKGKVSERPHFVLMNGDGNWYQYFLGQWKEIYKSSEEYK